MAIDPPPPASARVLVVAFGNSIHPLGYTLIKLLILNRLMIQSTIIRTPVVAFGYNPSSPSACSHCSSTLCNNYNIFQFRPLALTLLFQEVNRTLKGGDPMKKHPLPIPPVIARPRWCTLVDPAAGDPLKRCLGLVDCSRCGFAQWLDLIDDDRLAHTAEDPAFRVAA
jgi:hypothetical protein